MLAAQPQLMDALMAMTPQHNLEVRLLPAMPALPCLPGFVRRFPCSTLPAVPALLCLPA